MIKCRFCACSGVDFPSTDLLLMGIWPISVQCVCVRAHARVCKMLISTITQPDHKFSSLWVYLCFKIH